MQGLISRTQPTLIVLGLGWAVWLAGVLLQSPLVFTGIALANFAAAYALYHSTTSMPRGVVEAFRFLGYGVGVLGVAELLLGYRLLAGLDWTPLNDAIYLLGALLIGGGGLRFPWAIEQIGLHPQGYASRVTLASMLGGVALSWLLSLLFPIEPLQLAFVAITFFLTLLFASEVLAIRRLRFKRVLQYITWAFVLACVARLVVVFEVNTLISVGIYGLLWMLAMSIVVRVSR